MTYGAILKGVLRVLALLVALSSSSVRCGLLLPEPTCDPATQPCEIYVNVTGPREWQPVDDYTLEIGLSAWSLEREFGGGVGGREFTGTVRVRLVRPSDCASLVTFFADPNSYWVIRFDSSGTPHVEDWTGGAGELGPALSEGRLSRCP